jgi:hypothetical protein
MAISTTVNRSTTELCRANESREGFEPPTADSESTVLTDYTTRTKRSQPEEGGGRTREPEGFGP